MKKLPRFFEIYRLYHNEITITNEKYYVYIHKNPITGLIFYVGSAQGNPYRAYEFDRHRSEQWKNEVKSFGGFVNIKIEIVEYFKTAKSAQAYEYELIRQLHKQGEAYCSFEFEFI